MSPPNLKKLATLEGGVAAVLCLIASVFSLWYIRYATNDDMLTAISGEGFGLPLIEAAQHNLPIIARDIPVFREVAGDHAFFFRTEQPDELAKAIQEWLSLYGRNTHRRTDGLRWLTWSESAGRLLNILTDGTR